MQTLERQPRVVSAHETLRAAVEFASEVSTCGGSIAAASVDSEAISLRLDAGSGDHIVRALGIQRVKRTEAADESGAVLVWEGRWRGQTVRLTSPAKGFNR